MISTEALRLMARYNAWQNRALSAWAAPLSDAERRRERGLFWGSIMGTLNHLLWADAIWMHRLAGLEKPEVGLAGSPGFYAEWDTLTAARLEMDQRILIWTAGLLDRDLEGDLTWFSGASQSEMTQPRWALALHLFNHQTHHRGQLHAAATAAGLTPPPTDLMLTPQL